MGGITGVLLGVLTFSLTFPATRLALGAVEGQTGGFDPIVVGFGRTAIAALLAFAAVRISAFRVEGKRLPRHLVRPLLLVSLGNGLGFGALTAFALKSSTASHGAIVIAGLPIATAIVSVLRNRERPSISFWLASLGGTTVVFIVTIAHSSGGVTASDLLLLAAVGLGALGYAEGGRLAKTMPGILVVSWSVIFAFPIALIATLIALGTTTNAPDLKAWIGLGYVSFFSLFLGFVPFYRGLAEVGVTRASQMQLMQPLLTLAWSAVLIGEVIGWGTVLAAVIVLSFVVTTQRARIGSHGGPLARV
jgi:drug/metabolite transporter (DMT)-like permease